MNEEKVIQKLIEHDERLANIESKLDSLPTRQELLHGQDEMMLILKRLDQERVFTVEYFRRLEKEVHDNTNEIKQMKQSLKLV